MKLSRKIHTTLQRGRPAIFIHLLLVFFSLVSGTSHGITAAEVLKAYEGLTGAQREQKLVEGAKREGALTEYGITAIDSLQPRPRRIHKEIITTRYQRGGAVDTYNKIVNEARAKTLERGPVAILVEKFFLDSLPVRAEVRIE